MIRAICLVPLLIALAGCQADVSRTQQAREPPWSAAVVAGEPVMPLDSATHFHLWRPIEKVLALETRSGQRFTEGTDYRLEGGRLRIPPDSTIARVAPAELRAADGSPLIDESIQDRQIRVTYQAGGATPAPPLPKVLPRLQQKLRGDGPVAITFYGDSITQGWGADAGASFVELAAADLDRSYPGRIQLRTAGAAGWAATQGLAHVNEQVRDQAQDVVVIAFGMNDTSGAEGQYKREVRAMIEAVRARSPDTEFVLVSGMRANPEFRSVDNRRFDGFREDLHALGAELAGVTVVDVTAIWDDLMRRKTFNDLGSNGVNHPNAFGHLIYSQCVLEALIPPAVRND